MVPWDASKWIDGNHLAAGHHRPLQAPERLTNLFEPGQRELDPLRSWAVQAQAGVTGCSNARASGILRLCCCFLCTPSMSIRMPAICQHTEPVLDFLWGCSSVRLFAKAKSVQGSAVVRRALPVRPLPLIPPVLRHGKGPGTLVFRESYTVQVWISKTLQALMGFGVSLAPE